MKVSELLDVIEYHGCGVRVQNDALIDDGNPVLAEVKFVDDLKYDDKYDEFIDEEVTDLYAESNGVMVICILKEKEKEEE